MSPWSSAIFASIVKATSPCTLSSPATATAGTSAYAARTFFARAIPAGSPRAPEAAAVLRSARVRGGRVGGVRDRLAQDLGVHEAREEVGEVPVASDDRHRRGPGHSEEVGEVAELVGADGVDEEARAGARAAVGAHGVERGRDALVVGGVLHEERDHDHVVALEGRRDVLRRGRGGAHRAPEGRGGDRDGRGADGRGGRRGRRLGRVVAAHPQAARGEQDGGSGDGRGEVAVAPHERPAMMPRGAVPACDLNLRKQVGDGRRSPKREPDAESLITRVGSRCEPVANTAGHLRV